MDTERAWEGPAILHVDMDAFFAAVEVLDDPSLAGKPVIVGGSPDGRGVVSTCSYEARAYGVRSAMPSARAAQLCPDAVWVRGHFDRYREMSRSVRAIFERETPRVQPTSIDEAYLDVTPGRYANEHPVAVAARIQAGIDGLGLSASVGVARTKIVAKVASDAEKPHGLTVVWPGEEAAFLAPLPVRTMPGIGPKTAERLEALGVHTLGELAVMDDRTARAALGRYGASLVRKARGLDSRDVHPNDPAKSVSSERTFAEDVRSPADVDGALERLAAKVGRRLRAKGRAGRTVTVKLRFSDFTTKTVQRTLSSPTDDEQVFAPVARELVRTAWSPGVGLRLLGVGLSGFDAKTAQRALFDETLEEAVEPSEESARREAILRGVDAVRERFGDDAVMRGREVRAPSGRARTDDEGDAS